MTDWAQPEEKSEHVTGTTLYSRPTVPGYLPNLSRYLRYRYVRPPIELLAEAGGLFVALRACGMYLSASSR